MEEDEKKDWVEKFSKDELIEDIQREFATDARNNIGCSGLILLLLVYYLYSAYGTADWSSALWSLPTFLFILFAFDIWWKKKMSKCEDAHQLVDMYDKYNKANKTLSYVAAFALVLYICYDLYSDLGKVSTTSILITVAVVGVILGVIVWSLFRKIDKKPIDKEMDRLRELNTKE